MMSVMDPDEIINHETLEQWLIERPRRSRRDIALAITQRAVARVVPAWGAAMSEPWARSSELTALPILRLTLVSGVARKFPTIEFGAAAAVEAEAAHAVASAAAVDPISPNYVVFIDGNIAAPASEVVSAVVSAFAVVANSSATAVAASAAAAARATALAAWPMDSGSFFEQIRADAVLLTRNADPFAAPLWSGTSPESFTRAEAQTRTIWQKDDAAVWSFWARWLAGIRSGQQINWDLQRDIALIPDADWQQGPAHMAGLIAKLEAERQNHNDQQDSIENQIALLPSASSAVVTATRVSIAAHRLELPATMDAVLGYIGLEIERLQSRNYQSDDERDESQRQIRVLCSIHETVSKLNVVVSSSGDLTEPQVVQAEKLSRLFVRKFQEWPRANADELVDNCWRVALVGATAALLPMVGVSASIAASAGIVLFGGKKLVDGIKAAKEALSIGTGP